MWRHSWPADIIANLVSSSNREETITNSDLELAALVLHKDILIVAVPDARLAAPCSGSNNTPTVSWSTKEASATNSVVANLLCLHAPHLRQLFVNPSFFYHPFIDNHMAYDASHLYDLSDTYLLAHMYDSYPQPQSLWKLSLLPPYLLSCVISTLRRKPWEQELHKMLSGRGSTSSGATSAAPSRSILLSKIHMSLASRVSKSTGTVSDMPSTPSAEWTNLIRRRSLRHGGRLRRPTSWLASQTPGSPSTPRPTAGWTCDSPGSLKPMGSRNFQ